MKRYISVSPPRKPSPRRSEGAIGATTLPSPSQVVVARNAFFGHAASDTNGKSKDNRNRDVASTRQRAGVPKLSENERSSSLTAAIQEHKRNFMQQPRQPPKQHRRKSTEIPSADDESFASDRETKREESLAKAATRWLTQESASEEYGNLFLLVPYDDDDDDDDNGVKGAYSETPSETNTPALSQWDLTPPCQAASTTALPRYGGDPPFCTEEEQWAVAEHPPATTARDASLSEAGPVGGRIPSLHDNVEAPPFYTAPQEQPSLPVPPQRSAMPRATVEVQDESYEEDVEDEEADDSEPSSGASQSDDEHVATNDDATGAIHGTRISSGGGSWKAFSMYRFFRGSRRAAPLPVPQGDESDEETSEDTRDSSRSASDSSSSSSGSHGDDRYALDRDVEGMVMMGFSDDDGERNDDKRRLTAGQGSGLMQPHELASLFTLPSASATPPPSGTSPSSRTWRQHMGLLPTTKPSSGRAQASVQGGPDKRRSNQDDPFLLNPQDPFGSGDADISVTRGAVHGSTMKRRIAQPPPPLSTLVQDAEAGRLSYPHNLHTTPHRAGDDSRAGRASSLTTPPSKPRSLTPIAPSAMARAAASSLPDSPQSSNGVTHTSARSGASSVSGQGLMMTRPHPAGRSHSPYPKEMAAPAEMRLHAASVQAQSPSRPRELPPLSPDSGLLSQRRQWEEQQAQLAQLQEQIARNRSELETLQRQAQELTRAQTLSGTAGTPTEARVETREGVEDVPTGRLLPLGGAAVFGRSSE